MFFLIIGIIVAVVILILNIPLTLIFKADETTDFSVKFAFFKIYPFKHQEKGKTKNENYLKKRLKTKGLKSALEELLLYIKEILGALKGFNRKVKITDFESKIIVASADAAETAIQYGAVCAVFYPFISFLSSITNFSAKSISVDANYDSEKYQIYLFFKVKIKLIHLLSLLFKIVLRFIKIKKGEENERK